MKTKRNDHDGHVLKIHGKPRKMLLLVDEAQLAGCLKVWVGGLLEWDEGIQFLYVRRHSGYCL